MAAPTPPARITLDPLDPGMAHTLAALLQGALRAGPSPALVRITSQVEHLRVTHRTDFARLRLEIGNDGTCTPAELLRQGLAPLQCSLAELAGPAPGPASPSEQAAGVSGNPERQAPLPTILAAPVDELGLGVRTLLCLRSQHIDRVADLIAHSPADLLRLPRLGRRGLVEIMQALADHGLLLATPGPAPGSKPGPARPA
jgi:DNA-directed RNA polymerase subunit alpha